MTDEETAALIGAVITWFDNDATYGAAHPSTQAAMDRLRRQAACIHQPDEIEIEPDRPPRRPPFTVLPGGLE
jgi:hypothetical protein